MRSLMVATTKGYIKETVYESNELPLYEIMMHAPVFKKRDVYYLEVAAAFDIETTTISESAAAFCDFSILDHIKKLHLKYSDQVRKDIPDFEELRRKYFSVLHLSKTNGTPIDSAYMELSQYRPDLFPPDIYNPSDQLLKIIDVYRDNRIIEEFRPYAFMYQWQFCIDGFVCFGRTWEEFRTLLKRLQSEMNLSEKNRLVVYIHNAGFEFTFMKHFINVTESFFREENKPLKFLIDEGIEFRDSYALSNLNLAKFCENSGAIHAKLSGEEYNYAVIRTPETPLTEEEEAYCYNDVAGLVECIKSRMREYHLTEIPLTSTGYVRRLFRNNMRKNEQNRKIFKETALSADLYKMHKQAFRGGDVHGNPAYADQTLYNVDSMDISSAYPAALVISDHFPIGAYHKISARRFRTARKKDCCYIMRLRIDRPRYHGSCGDPYISYSKITALHEHENNADMVLDNGRLRYFDGIIEMSVLDIDYDIIRSEYAGTYYVSDVYEAQAGMLPDEFRQTIIDLFCQKTDLKGLEEFYYYYCRVKEMINAAYGMCATKIDQADVVYDQKTHSFEEIEKPLEEVLKKYYKNRNNFLPYQWGCFCTAIVRAKLHKAMEDGAGKYNVYADTDSCKFISRKIIRDWFETENEKLIEAAKAAGAAAKDRKGKFHYIGAWEFEGTFSSFRHIGSKRYCGIIDGKYYVTIAGVNKARAAEFFTNAGIEKFTDGTIIDNSGHLVAYYNDDAPHKITVEGCTFETASNVALVNDVYTLGIDRKYGKLIADLKKNIVAQEYI